MREKNLTEGGILKTMLIFSIPMILGNLLQQIYNIADTMVVGHFVGAEALAAVGSAYTLMTFITSIIIGLCMGSSAVFSMAYGAGNKDELKESIWVSFWFILTVTVMLHAVVVLFNNIVLDIWFVAGLKLGVRGAAEATVISQAVSGIGIAVFTMKRMPELRIPKEYRHFGKEIFHKVTTYSFLTCAQQSVMNLGILMIQGLVNSFGTVIMAAFAVAVKIDTLAYMPAQEFGNAFSLFISQNYGAGKFDRIEKGVKQALAVSTVFCMIVSAIVWIFSPQMIEIFLDNADPQIIKAGVDYLHIEGVFYFGIGCLFLLYGLYRAINKPMMSLILTILSLGTRVALAYLFAPNPLFGVNAIWWAIPIGWGIADVVGIMYYQNKERHKWEECVDKILKKSANLQK